MRIHPFFWIVVLILGLSGGQPTPPGEVIGWILAVLVSILIHELGHAVVQRRYGGHPRIILYGLGGMAVCNDCDRSSRAQILISLAGPGAGFLFALLILLTLRVVGHQAGLTLGGASQLVDAGYDGIPILGIIFYWKPFTSESVEFMVRQLLWINVLWGVVNLLPIYPLDGGRVSRELCLLGQPQRGILLSLQISMIAAGAMVFVGLSWRSLFVSLFFAYLAYSSYRNLEAYKANLW